MADVLRKTGIPLVETLPWGTSLALFYETEHDLLDTCAGYLAAGLQSNELCIWLTHESVPREAARVALKDILSDFDRHESAGGITILARDELAVRGGAFDARRVMDYWRGHMDAARKRGYEGLRVSANAWVAAGDRRQYFEFHGELLGALEGQPILALGTYDLAESRGVDVLDVIRLHHLTIARRRGEWQFMETPELKHANARIRQLNDALAVISKPFPGCDLLTERERAVLAQIVTGASSKEIAREFSVSPRTVDFHRANILQKLGARNTAEVIGVVLGRE